MIQILRDFPSESLNCFGRGENIVSDVLKRASSDNGSICVIQENVSTIVWSGGDFSFSVHSAFVFLYTILER